LKIAESEVKQNKVYLEKGVRTALKVENGDAVEFHVLDQRIELRKKQ